MLFVLLVPLFASAAGLPFETVFKGRSKFDALVAQGGKWKALPIGERTAAVGRAMTGTPYKNYTLEIDNRIEAPSANLLAMDCWTFFEQALAFARMLDEPPAQWTPQTFLKYIEMDRYRGGDCDGSYLSRLHYLEEWIVDNARRGLVQNITGSLGGSRVSATAREMTVNWRSYRYMKANPDLRAGIRRMESRVEDIGMTMLAKGKVAGIEGKLRNGDVICVATRDSGGYGTSHVGLAVRGGDGVLRFMHASHPRNYGKVVVDSRLSEYLNRFKSIAGIMVARPLK
ncbi:MAG: N-acetylmuramoyl-L-alanine amidase-like domain-containing protein [Chthoniobacteraceae bacterium]